MQRGVLGGLMATVLLAAGGHAWADDPGNATSDVTVEDPAKATSDAPATAPAKSTSDTAASKSLIELAPIVVDINRRYFKFYGDPNTVNGGILERSYLTDNWLGSGLRDKLVDAGVYLDVGMTQWGGGNVYGGTDTNGNYFGSLDLWVNLDTAKLSNGLWPGATIFLHGEVGWGRNFSNPKGIEQSVGATIPTNYDITMPNALNLDTFYLSEYYLVQALSPKISAWVGQMNGAGLIDGNQFANDEKHQFLNTVLVDNPTVGPFAPYTAFTIAGVWLPTTEHVFIAGVMDQNGSVSKSVASTYDADDGTVVVASYGFLPDWGGLPGRYQIVGAYSNKNTPDYQVGNRLSLLGELVGVVPIKEKKDNWVTIGTFDQYLYVKDKEKQIGWGLFARYGYSPKNRNAIDQFYSVGVGGRGLLIPGRDLDFWGLGWGGSHFSSDLRDDLQDLTSLPLLGRPGVKLEAWEHVVEAFYNIEVAPWAHLTIDLQFIVNPVGAQVINHSASVDDDRLAIVFGGRLQIDF
jgi:porin